MNEKQYHAQQDSFLKTVANVTKFALAAAEAFWLSMTQTYFRNFAQAAAEVIDNSIEAGANTVAVHVIATENGRSIDKIVFFDDGYGMKPKMIEAALTYGGTQRHDSREGTGRFGMGLPNSTFTQADKVTVISKKRKQNDVYSVEVDGDLIKSGAYNNKDNNGLDLPNAKKTSLPKELMAITESYGSKFDRGTFVVLEKTKRLKIKNPDRLINHLKTHLGVIFNKILAIPTGNKDEVIGKLNLFINGERVMPCDPLFLTPGALGYDDDNDRAESFGQTKVIFEKDGIKANITCDYALVSPTYWRVNKKNTSTAKENTLQRRFEVVSAYHGINIYRNNRLIDVVPNIPKYVWSNMPSGIKTRFMNNDRAIRVSLSFDPVLDEYFGVEVTKQQAMPNEFIWQKLWENGFFGIIGSMTSKDKAARDKLKTNKEVEEANGLNPAEEILSDLAKLNETEVTTEEKSFRNAEGEKNLEAEAVSNVKKLNLPETPENISKQKEVIVSNQSLPVKIDYEDMPMGPFFRFDHIGETLVIFINKDHEFYKNLYAHHETSAYARRGLDVFLGVLANRMNASKDSQTLFRRSLHVWSRDLCDALTMLFDNHSTVHEEDDSITQDNKEVKTS